jgi:cytochrome c5
MCYRFHSAMVACALASMLTGCETATSVSHEGPPGTPVATASAGTPLSAEQRPNAKRLYEAKCARCHQFYNPADYSKHDWESWMTKMSRKAHLKPDQEELLGRYLEELRVKSTTP